MHQPDHRAAGHHGRPQATRTPGGTLTSLPAASRQRRRGRSPRSGGQRGSASTELVLATPLLLLLLLGVVQFALWEHATHIAQAAAGQGLAAARVQGGSAAAGQQQVLQVLGQLGTGVLTTPAVAGGRATVTVTGRAEAVLPFLHLPVTATATGPLEPALPPGAAR